MAGYTIFIPGVQGANNEHLQHVGIESLAVDRNPEWAEVIQGGPDGGRGMLCAWRQGNLDHDAHMSMHSDLEWTPAPPDIEKELPMGRYWIGIDTVRKCRPDDIERNQRQMSNAVELCDKQVWAVPIAERLPHRHGIDPTTGDKVRRVAPEYRDFWDASQDYAIQVFQEMDALDILKAAKPDLAPKDVQVEFAFQEVWTYALFALSINYRLNDALMDRLELLDDASTVRVICATIDMPSIIEVRDQKKTDTDSVRMSVS